MPAAHDNSGVARAENDVAFHGIGNDGEDHRSVGGDRRALQICHLAAVATTVKTRATLRATSVALKG